MDTGSCLLLVLSALIHGIGSRFGCWIQSLMLRATYHGVKDEAGGGVQTWKQERSSSTTKGSLYWSKSTKEMQDQLLHSSLSVPVP